MSTWSARPVDEPFELTANSDPPSRFLFCEIFHVVVKTGKTRM